MTKTQHSDPKSKKRPLGKPATWRDLVRETLSALGGTASLSALYEKLASHPRSTVNPHWKDKIRQVVQLDPQVERVDKGVWRFKA